MRGLVTAILVWAGLVAGGCSSLSSDAQGPYGAPDEAWLLLARGEAAAPEAALGELRGHWRKRLCDTERQAESALARKVQAEIETVWAEIRLHKVGKELPALTKRLRNRMVNGVMAESRLIGRVRAESGRFEAYQGVRLSGRFAACLRETCEGRECARPPVKDSVPACGKLTPAPEPLYFLEGA